MLSKSRTLAAAIDAPVLVVVAATCLAVCVGSAGSARADCNPAVPVDDDAVVCDDLSPSTGYDGSGAMNLTITTTGNAILDDSDPGLDSALLLGDLNTVTIGVDATMNVTEDDGFGMRAGDNNFVDNLGTINILGLDGRAISIGDNTNDILPNGAINSGTINAMADRGYALETGFNSGVATTGVINLDGNETRGISAADRSDPTIRSNITNQGDININGNDAYGIKAGDGWVQGQIVSGFMDSEPAVRNQAAATIAVSGDRSFGIFVGDELNLMNNNNSFVLNRGLIDVTGTDAVGVSVGGNDLLGIFDFQGTTPLSVTSVENLGEIVGDADSGPLVLFRNFVAGNENSVRNDIGGRIIADMTNFGMPDRAIAIRGTAGAEFIVNLGEIEGIIELGAGDDRYAHTPRADFTGEIRGGAGNDRVILVPNSDDNTVTFNAGALVNVETLEVGGGDFGWELMNGAAFTGVTEVAPLGRLRIPASVTLGGDFAVDPTATLEVTIEPTTTLTVLGASTFDGSLIPTPGAGVTAGPTQYRVINALGGYTGQFDITLTSGSDVFVATYDAAGLLIQYVGDSLVAVARGANQRAIAQHLVDITAVGSPSPALQNLLDEVDASTGTLANVFHALNPEIYDAHTTALVEGGRQVSNLLFDRPRECEADEIPPWQGAKAALPCHARRWSPWLATIGSHRTREEIDQHSRYNAQLAGLVFGIDVRPMKDVDLTVAVSSQRGTIDGASRGSSTLTMVDLTGQAAWRRGPLRVQGALGWGHGFHKDRRRIRFAETGLTSVDRRGLAEHDSDRISIAMELGYELEVGPFKVEPIGGLDWAWVYQRPINEAEGFGFGVRIDRRDDSVGSINAGVRMSTSYVHSKYLGRQLLWMDGTWRPTVEVRWRQILTGYEREIQGRLSGAPDSVSDFTVEGREDPGGAEVGVALSFLPKNANRLQFDLRYEAFLSPNTVAHNLVAQAMIGF